MSGTLTYTLQTDLPTDPNFPAGWVYQDTNSEAFDFTRNRYYHHVIGSGNAGIVVVDLGTMHVIQTATLNQMYAGTPYGTPAGTPVEQVIWDIGCGNGTDIYIRTSYTPGVGVGTYCHFTRVDATTLKITGDYFVSATLPPPIRCVVTNFGPIVNKTATHTIVAYLSNPGVGAGPQVFDGTGMAPIGMGPSLTYSPYNVLLMPGASASSCDFLLLNFDSGTSGHIDIWRLTVTDSLVLTSTKTGTVNVLPIFTPSPALAVPQANYDVAHNRIILWLTNTPGGGTGPPIWLVSVNLDGTVAWVTPLPSDVGVNANAHSQLTGTTLMVGSGSALKIIDTSTGAITFTGSVPLTTSPGSFFRIWDAGRNAYWTYTFGVTFTRIDFISGGGGPGPGPGSAERLAMDNVLATVTTTLLEVNLISLRWSDDRGHVWGSPVTQDIGEAGEYRTSLQWQRLGMARDRVFEVSWSVPMRTALQGAWVDVIPAQS